MSWIFIPAGGGGAYDFQDCLQFDGIDDYCDMPTAMTSTSFSFSCWFNTDSTSNKVIVGSSTNTTAFIRINNSTTIDVRYTTVRYAFTVPTISTGSWYHLLVASNGSQTRVYLNGVESTTGALSTSAVGISFDRISGRGFGDQFYDGLLDDFLFETSYGSPATESTALYNGGAGVDPLTVYAGAEDLFRFNGNGNNDGSNGGSLTLNNFPASPYTPHV